MQNAFPAVSMALLQGHLLRYKNDSHGAIEGVRLLAEEKKSKSSGLSNKANPAVPASASAPAEGKAKASSGSKRRVLTVEEVDKMYFNPQSGWDKDIPNI